MIALLLLASGPDLSAITDPTRRHAVERCESPLTRRAGGEVSAIDVTTFHRTRLGTDVKGTMQVLQRPVVRPGEMTPAHIVNRHYRYDCQLNGRGAPRVKVTPLDD